MSSHRTERLNSEFQKSISDIISNRLKDPRVTEMVSVMKVDAAKDLKTAKVYVSIYGDKEKAKSTFEALKLVAGFIRKELSVDFKAIRMVPSLTFILDDSMEYSENINKILQGLKNEPKDNN